MRKKTEKVLKVIELNLLRVGDVAASLGVSKDVVYGLIYKGELRPTRVGGRYRITENELERYLDAGQVRPIKEGA